MFVISHRGYAAVGVYAYVCVLQPHSGLRVGSSICDEEVSSWLGPHGAVQAAARWSIIYYRTSLLLYVTNALRRDGLLEVNAARLTLVPSDKHCRCLIWRSISQISGCLFKSVVICNFFPNCQVRPLGPEMIWYVVYTADLLRFLDQTVCS